MYYLSNLDDASREGSVPVQSLIAWVLYLPCPVCLGNLRYIGLRVSVHRCTFRMVGQGDRTLSHNCCRL